MLKGYIGYCIAKEDIYNGNKELVIRKGTLCRIYYSIHPEERMLIKVFKDDISLPGLHGIKSDKYEVLNTEVCEILYGK